MVILAFVFFCPPSSPATTSIVPLKKGVVKISSQIEGIHQIGTGVIIRLEPRAAYILTASHVIEGDPRPFITFYAAPTQPMPGRIIGMDSRNPKGLATLVVTGDLPADLQPLQLASTLNVEAGSPVTLIGFPRIPPVPWAVTQGIITGMDGQDVVISGSANEGNSGGPVIIEEQVVAIVTEVANDFVYAVPTLIAKLALQGWGITPHADQPSSPPDSKDSGLVKKKQPLPPSPAKPQQPTVKPPSPTESIQKNLQENNQPPASTTPPLPSPPQKTGHDQTPMVSIPSGEFFMGSEPDEKCEWDSIMKVEFCLPDQFADYAPRHRVILDAFYLDQYEVSFGHFQRFVEETGYTSTVNQRGDASAWIKTSSFLFGDRWKQDQVSHADWRTPKGKDSGQSINLHDPVVQISWHDAQAYCQWAEKRLPTEAEWEYAARAGTDTKHWWGDSPPTSIKPGNFADARFNSTFDGKINFPDYDDGFSEIAPVGSFAPNPWGLYDMVGNVWEWTADWYDSRYYRDSQEDNPKGPSEGKKKVKRGGSWANYAGIKYRATQGPEDSDDQTGFRCAKSVLQ